MIQALRTAILFAFFAIAPAARAADAFYALPRDEAMGSQIEWFVNDTNAAMVAAVESGKMLVLVIGNESSRFTQLTASRVAPCPHLNQLAGLVVFAYGSPSVDEFARRIAVRRTITDYPTFLFIEPRTDDLTEAGRMEGFFDALTIAQDIRTAAMRANLWPLGVSLRPLPRNRFAYPNMACTPDGAAELLKR